MLLGSGTLGRLPSQQLRPEVHKHTAQIAARDPHLVGKVKNVKISLAAEGQRHPERFPSEATSKPNIYRSPKDATQQAIGRSLKFLRILLGCRIHIHDVSNHFHTLASHSDDVAEYLDSKFVRYKIGELWQRCERLLGLFCLLCVALPHELPIALDAPLVDSNDAVARYHPANEALDDIIGQRPLFGQHSVQLQVTLEECGSIGGGLCIGCRFRIRGHHDTIEMLICHAGLRGHFHPKMRVGEPPVHRPTDMQSTVREGEQ
eukprot:CAMPEP_0115859704 /NCGR_PEP_ID=MMETSP0287-20121206/16753_1 /TAXON_ID=412157 /ORGANISM="Chrysochromulina rotalis, Strain UIO044" /LENGTH=260 /DNA_ID=CAMNT_0003314013 /DNA_START=185 /DNA_END=968 /DNA_ORIENTATION=+